MGRIFFSFIFVLVSTFNAAPQEREARQIDEFGRLPCGEMLARLTNIYYESQKEPDSKIYVIYYGGRFRKEEIRNKKTNKIDSIQLKYPHREDALNLAKAIPLYLTTVDSYSAAERNAFVEKVVLINGGFQENIKMEIWLVPTDFTPPKPTPTIHEKDIKFVSTKPFGTPDWKCCYENC